MDAQDGFGAVILAGGTAARLGGVDKAAVELAGSTLLEHALAAVRDAAEVVVVGDPVVTTRAVRFTRESPRYGGPAAGLLAGLDALVGAPGAAGAAGAVGSLGVLAVDMPRVTPDTFGRLRAAAAGRDGAVLVDPGGRRQLAMVVDVARLDAVRPDRRDQHDLALHRLLARLDLAEVPAHGEEHRDVDTWDDLRDLTP